MKILVIVSTVDLKFDYGCTLQWWQLLKGLYEEGVELVVTPYLGFAIEEPWWRVYKNPCRIEGQLYLAGKKLFDKLNPPKPNVSKKTFGEKAVRQLVRVFIQPKWRSHIDLILCNEAGIDFVLVLNLPLNQFVGLPTYIKSRYHLPVVYYDGDVPASLPKFGGYASGFRGYDGADLSEYDVFISNSQGGIKELKTMGAKNIHLLYYGADPTLFAPVEVKQDIDVFFYGLGYEYRKAWFEQLITYPSRLLPESRFIVRGSGFDAGIDLGRSILSKNVPLSRLKNYVCRSKINLNITRDAHASIYASSTARLFELASMGCCIVSNPCKGIEEWFEPGKEIFIVHNQKEAIDTYRHLLANQKLRQEVGLLARQRLLREHTYKHRARALLRIFKKNNEK